jgi:transcriptional regulator with XRE-family HTH domain
MTGEELRERRMALHLSQATLADKLGVTKNTVARWERGELTMANPKMIDMSLKQLEGEMEKPLTHPEAMEKVWDTALSLYGEAKEFGLADLPDDATDEDIVEGMLGNYPQDLVDAADGDIAAIFRVRQGIGLPIIR